MEFIAAAASAKVEVWVEWVLYVLLAGLLYFPFRIYGRIARAVGRGEGQVPTPYGFADLPLTLLLVGWLGLAALGASAHEEERQITQQALLQNVVIFSVIAGGIAIFLQARKISVWRAFGLGRVAPGRAFGSGLGYLLAAYPLVLLGNLLMIGWLGEGAKRQEILEFFTNAASKGNAWQIWGVIGMAAIAAPLLEEVLFRGYFYGVFRRFGGPWVGMLVCSALFAAIHGNLLATPGLFLLAVCFTLAYERTGSLLVPIIMHAIFNTTTLVLLYLSSSSLYPSPA